MDSILRLFSRFVAAATLAVLVGAIFAGPATAATPEGTTAALLLQVQGGLAKENNEGDVIGAGFDCDGTSSEVAFDGDFPESGPCLKFFSTEQTITLIASPRAGYVFWRWQCLQYGVSRPEIITTTPAITLSTELFPFGSVGVSPHPRVCRAQFQIIDCSANHPPGSCPEDCSITADDNRVAGQDLAAAQIEQCPEDNECPEDAIVGDENDNTIFGTEGDDVICGLGGDDFIKGLGGNDLIYGGSGDDSLIGDDGDDVLVGDSGVDSLLGGNGNDALLGGAGRDTAFGEAGNDDIAGGPEGDLLFGDGGNDGMAGDDGNDLMTGGPGDDRLDGGVGADALFGCGGSDTLDGDSGKDNLFGDIDDAEGGCQLDDGDPNAGNTAPARDVLIGGKGNDELFGNGRNDTLRGGKGDDELNGGSGKDELFGDSGDDLLIAGSGRDDLHGGPGDDALNARDQEVDHVNGDGGCDAMFEFFDPGLDILESIERPNEAFCP